MTRRRQSLFEDIVDTVSLLPWWMGVVLAVVAYAVLHHFATVQVAPSENLRDMGAVVSKSMIRGLAVVGQYLLPGLFLLGALGSGITRVRTQKRFEQVRQSARQDALLDMSWQEFEAIVGEFFRRRGYVVRQLGGRCPDGGVDLVASKGTDRYFVQCKQWRARKVGVQTVRELYGVMSAEGAAGGFVITSGQFTDEAKKFVEGLNIRLFDGSHLHRMIREAEKETAVRQVGSSRDTNVVPGCPRCGRPMVRRVARQGRYAGREFWGCSGFPGCRQTMPIT